jgi:hypothetical protein
MCFKIIVLYLNHSGLVWPTAAELCPTAADAKFSIPATVARIQWADSVLSS